MLAFIGAPGPMELGIILLIVLVFFGAGKLPQVFESFGKGIKALKNSMNEDPIDISPREEIPGPRREISDTTE